MSDGSKGLMLCAFFYEALAQRATILREEEPEKFNQNWPRFIVGWVHYLS